MELYQCISISIIILSLTGVLDKIFDMLNMKKREVVFMMLSVSIFSIFKINLAPQAEVNMSVIVLPVHIMILLIENRKKRPSYEFYKTLLALVYLPIIVNISTSVYEILINDYASLELNGEVTLFQLLLCIFIVLFRSISISIKRRKHIF